jgi:predicted DNA-binding protein (UPF0251 family)
MSRRRCRRGRRGRFPKPVTIPTLSKVEQFTPQPQITANPITIEPAEIEALRLVDLEGLFQQQAGMSFKRHHLETSSKCKKKSCSSPNRRKSPRNYRRNKLPSKTIVIHQLLSHTKCYLAVSNFLVSGVQLAV